MTDFTGNYHNLWWGTDAAISPSGDLYVTTGLWEQTWPSVFRIDKGTGAVTPELSGLTQTEGIAFDPAGDMFLAEYDTDAILKVPVGSHTPVVLAHLEGPSRMAIGPDGLLYALAGELSGPRPMGRATEIWRIDPNTVAATLFADGLPQLIDIGFAPVPEPVTVLLLAGGFVLVFRRPRRHS